MTRCSSPASSAVSCGTGPAERAKTWAHEVQVGPATVVSEGGQFHVVAEADGGATITCLEGQVGGGHPADARRCCSQRDEAVSIAADGETLRRRRAASADAGDHRLAPPVGPGPPSEACPHGTGAGAVGVDSAVILAAVVVVHALLALVAVLLVVLDHRARVRRRLGASSGVARGHP